MKLGPGPAPWAHAIAVAVGALAGAATTVAALMNSPNMPWVGVAVPAVLGAAASGALVWATARVPRGGLVAIAASVGLTFVGGPVLAAMAIAIKAVANGAPDEVMGAVMVALAGIACGFFLTIPIGLALGVVNGAAVGLARLTVSDG